MQILHVLKAQYLGKIRCLNTTPESITGDVGLPRIKIYILSATTVKPMNVSFIKMKRGLIRVHKHCRLALDIAWSYILIFLLPNLRVSIGRHVAS